MKVKLVKINSSHERLRTDEIDGKCAALPKCGKSFIMIGESLSGNGVRCIQTTPVVRCHYEDGDTILFDTANSSYRLELK